MIRFQVIGNLTKDCQVNEVNQKKVINFTVAHNEKYKDANGVENNRVTYVDCNYWTDKTAVAQYLKKGGLVYIEGQPSVRTYTTQDGKNGASLNVRVNNIQLLGGNSQSNQQNQNNGNSEAFNQFVENTKDNTDLPF